MKLPLAVAVLAATTLSASAQTFQSSAGELKVETVVSGLCQSVGARLPARRPDAGDGETRPAAHRHARRQAVAARRRRAPGVRGRARAACTTSSSTASFAQNGTIYFCYAEPVSGGGRTALAARQARRRSRAQARRRQGDLSARTARSRAASISAAASCRRRDNNLFLTHGRPLPLSRRGAEPRQSSRQAGPHRAGRLGAAGQSLRRPRRRQAGDLVIRPPQHAGRGAQSDHRQALEPEHGPRGGDEVNIPEQGQELRLAGDRLRHRLQRREDPRGTQQGRHGAAGQILGAVDRAVRHGVLHRRSVSEMEGLACSSARWPARCLVRLDVDGETITGEERLLQGFASASATCASGRTARSISATDNSAGRILRVSPK